MLRRGRDCICRGLRNRREVSFVAAKQNLVVRLARVAEMFHFAQHDTVSLSSVTDTVVGSNTAPLHGMSRGRCRGGGRSSLVGCREPMRRDEQSMASTGGAL